MSIILNITRCSDAASSDYSPAYPLYAEVFSLANNPIGVTINASTGLVSIGTVVKGEYFIVVKYRVPLGEGEYTYYSDVINLLSIDCTTKLNKTSYVFCKGGPLQITLSGTTSIEAINTGQAWANDAGGGVIDVNSDEMTIGTTYTMEAVFGDETRINFTIKAIDCNASNFIPVTFCEKDGLQVVWKNRAGGWNNYWLIQDKLYSVDQEEGKSFMNINEEELWNSRNNIFDFVEINDLQVPKQNVQLIRSLRDSIQAYIATDITDPLTFVPIKLDAKSFNLYQSSQEYFSYSFRFKYAKRRKVQQQ